jgi:hypothetical protein
VAVLWVECAVLDGVMGCLWMALWWCGWLCVYCSVVRLWGVCLCVGVLR